jgi:radical SAM superfamily enzyme YgiQ (UPF0313 family)
MDAVRALLISTYDLGRQPFGLASPAAWLRREGLDVSCVDLSKEKISEDVVRSASLVAFHLPMHTATRLAGPVIQQVRVWNKSARLCAYGLYAPLNADWLRSLGVDDVFGGEFEEDLTSVSRELLHPSGDSPNGGSPAVDEPAARSPRAERHSLPRLQFLAPDRSGLPPLTRYATLQLGTGESRVTGYTEASRGCRHRCRHCPVVPIYEGQFRIVQADVVAADIAAQVAAGAQHITFGDPDFLNGPTHALRTVEALHEAHSSVTYDVTVKIEHLLRHRALLPRLRDTGCVLITSAVESIDDRVLAFLDKGHTRQDFVDVVDLCRENRVTLTPTFVAFHPWLSLEDYCDLLDTIAALDLVDHVAPIQLAIRLLIPAGSRLLELAEIRPWLGGFDPATLAYRWSHPDPRVDRLHANLSAIVANRLTADRREVFAEVSAVAHERAGIPAPSPPNTPPARVPYLSEPWYCCAEPAPDQLRVV